jgi:hypothetical protein
MTFMRWELDVSQLIHPIQDLVQRSIAARSDFIDIAQDCSGWQLPGEFRNQPVFDLKFYFALLSSAHS